MLVLSSPSGAGKTTLSRRLLESDPGDRPLDLGDHAKAARRARSTAATIISSTARASTRWSRAASCSNGPRCSATATARRARPSTRRWRPAATCCSTSTGRAPSNCARKARDDLVSVFVLPPSIPELEQRLRSARPGFRRGDPIARMAKAADEMSHWAEYDYVVINRRVASTPSTMCAPFSARNASSANASPGCPPSCVRCRRTCDAYRRRLGAYSRHIVSTTRPTTRPARRSSSADCACRQRTLGKGTGTAAPPRTSASSSAPRRACRSRCPRWSSL